MIWEKLKYFKSFSDASDRVKFKFGSIPGGLWVQPLSVYNDSNKT